MWVASKQKILFLLLFLFSAKIVLAGEVSQFVFTANSQNIKPNEISEILSVQSQDSNGNSVKLSQTGCLHLSSASDTGEFSSSNTNWKPVNELTMNKNTANRNFYYKDSAVGNHVLTVEAALVSCSGWEEKQWEVKQNINVSESTSLDFIGAGAADNETTGIILPIEPQISANAGQDKIGIAGADIVFSGKALGIKKEPLERARYLWNFGDGSTAEGQNVRHFYKYPGEYIAVLDVSSGEYSSADYMNVKIIANEIKIIEAGKDIVKISNDSSVNLDISGWFLRAGNKMFKFPPSTLIKANSVLPVSSSVSGFDFVNYGSEIEFLYPNGSLAYGFVASDDSNNISKPLFNSQKIENSKVDNAVIKDSQKDFIKEASKIVENQETFYVKEENYQQSAAAFGRNAKKESDWKWWTLAGLVGMVSSAGYLVNSKLKVQGSKL